MLENIDLTRKLDKVEYKKLLPALEVKLGELQRKARELKVPVIIVFEGWDAAGKGTLINKLILSLDPRGCTVYPTNPPTEEERLRPFLWRFWMKTPERGRIAVFDRSWYGRVLVERVDKLIKKNSWQKSYESINAFERQLADAGNIIIKFYLHISKEVQKKRFRKLLKNPATAWKVSKEDWRHHKQYRKYLAAVEDMLGKTGKPWAPWTVVESHDERYATEKVFRTVVESLEEALAKVARARKAAEKAPAHKPAKPERVEGSILDKVDLSVALTKVEYEKQLEELQQRMWELEHEIYKRRVPVIITYEGWDAAGKGGNIKRLVRTMDPRGYEVVPIAAPNDVEKDHHYLWRFWIRFPKAGHIAIFDRTWYGRVLVERVEGFCREDDWKRAYTEINEMEEQFVDFGGVLVKLWIHIDKNEQLKRFQLRQKDPHKQWKITDEDWRNREKWDAYKQAVDEMLVRTSTVYAPWTVVEADSKYYARIKTLKSVIAAVEKRLKK